MEQPMPTQKSPVSPKDMLPSMRDLLEQTLSYFRDHWKLLTGIMVPPFAFSLLGTALNINRMQEASFPMLMVSLLLALATIAVAVLARTALLFSVSVPNGTALSVREAYQRSIPFVLPFVWISVLEFFAGLGGFILLIIPGILVALSLIATPYILLFEGERGMPVLVRSWYYVQGKRGDVFLKLFLFGILIVLASGTLGLFATSLTDKIIQNAFSNFIVSPFFAVFALLIYRSLKNSRPEPIPGTDAERIRKKLKIFMIIGGIAVPVLLVGGIFLALYIIGNPGLIPVPTLPPSV